MNSFYNLKVFRQIAFAAFAFACNCASAQDLIVKKDGTVIQAKVTKIGTSEVEYKKWSNQDGPQYSIAVADILAINYMNGEKEMFENVSANGNGKQSTATEQQTSTTPKEETAVPSPDNKLMIDRYNNQFVQKPGTSVKDKIAQAWLLVCGITSNSILSDNNISAFFSPIYYNVSVKESVNEVRKRLIGYAIKVLNKTDENIYIDLANSFKIDDIGNSVPYYSNKTYTVSGSSSAGAGVNLGAVTGALGVGGAIGTLASGINVGGGKTGGTSVTETAERFMIIPPHGTVTMPLSKRQEQKSFEDVPETFCPTQSPSTLDIRINEYRDLWTEENTISTYRRIITYSTNPNFTTVNKLNIGIYLKGALGEPKLTWGWKGLNPSTLLASDWNYLILGVDGFIIL